MKTVFAITLTARLQVGRQALWTGLAATGEEALASAMDSTKKNYGDLAWVPTLTTTLDLSPEALGFTPVKEEMVVDKGKNWAMATVITHKDLYLFNALQPYLSQPEKLFINDKADFGINYENKS